MRQMSWLMALAAAVVLTGCTPEPAQVCARAEQIANEGKGQPIANCVMRMTMKKDTRPKEYRKLAPCIMEAKTVEALNGCLGEQQGEQARSAP